MRLVISLAKVGNLIVIRLAKVGNEIGNKISKGRQRDKDR